MEKVVGVVDFHSMLNRLMLNRMHRSATALTHEWPESVEVSTHVGV